MGQGRNRDAEDGHGPHVRRRHHGRDSHHWKQGAEAPRDSPPHPQDGQVHRSARGTLRREQSGSGSSSSSSRTLDATESTMPPPPHLARSSTDVYRRPRHWMAYDDGGNVVGGRRPSRRDVSPTVYHRRVSAADFSGHSSAASGLVYGQDDQIEVVEEADDDEDEDDDDDDQSTRYKGDRQSSRDAYTMSSADRRHHRRHRRQRHVDDQLQVVRRRHSFSNGGSPSRESSLRTAERSVSSRHGRRQPVQDVIEDSRPPVSSLRSIVKRRHRSAEVIGHQDKPRGASPARPSRSRFGSVSGGPSGILGNIFGMPSSRRGSPEKHAKEPKAAKRVECVICMGDVSPSKAARLKCGHSMCRPCLERIFRLSISDAQHMPPRCCTQEHIPLRHVERLFDDGFKRTWNRKFAEFSTKNRLYCPSRKCGEWIQPGSVGKENGRKVARCGRCKTKVCAVCNGKWHGSEDCPKDEETTKLLAQAQEEGWKRCYRCRAIVELKEGCNHMTCRCDAQFCMLCGVKWKGCDCPWFNDGSSLQADVREHMNPPAPQIRGDLRDVFDGDAPGEPRAQHPVTMTLPVRPRPRSYQEEMLLRRLQEQRDTDMARHVRYSDEHYDAHDTTGVVGVDAEGKMDDYRRGGGGRFRASIPRPDRGADYGARGSRGNAGDSMEQRLADRLSEKRPAISMRPGLGPGPMAAAMRAAAARPGSGSGPGRGLRQHSIEGELYNSNNNNSSSNNINGSPRSERVVSGRAARTCEDEIEVHRPRSRRRGREERPRPSDLAGLNGLGQGMNRVSQWRSFVEPGVPDGESTVGHA